VHAPSCSRYRLSMSRKFYEIHCKKENLTRCPWSVEICKKFSIFPCYLHEFFHYTFYLAAIVSCSRGIIQVRKHMVFFALLTRCYYPLYGRIIIRNERSKVNKLHLFRAFCCRYIEVTFSTYHTVRLCDEGILSLWTYNVKVFSKYNIYIIVQLCWYHALKKSPFFYGVLSRPFLNLNILYLSSLSKDQWFSKFLNSNSKYFKIDKLLYIWTGYLYNF